MLQFVKNAYRMLWSILLWVVLVGSGIGGGVGGYLFASLINFLDNRILSIIIGVVVGIAVGLTAGLLFDILVGGFIATILSIERNTSGQHKNGANIFDNAGDMMFTEQMEARTRPMQSRKTHSMPDENIFGNIDDVVFDEQEEDLYVAKVKTLIKANPKPDSLTKKILDAGDVVYLQRLGVGTKWFHAKSIDGIEGWCFVAHFKKN